MTKPRPGIVVYHLVLGRIAGCVKAGVFLSQVLYWRDKVRRPFWKTHEEWTAETGLSRREVDTARKRWRELGVLKETLKGFPPVVWFDVNHARLANLAESAKSERSRPAPIRRKAPNQLAESAKLNGRNPPTSSLTTSPTIIPSVLHTASPPKDAKHDVDYAAQDGKLLAQIDRLIPNYRNGRLRPSQLKTVKTFYGRCYEIWEQTERGETTNGWAYRLCDELAGILADNGMDPVP